MARRLSDEKWIEIKTRYQLGHIIRAIARDYDITEGAIRSRAKLENWGQDLRNDVSVIKDKINEITHKCVNEQMPIIQQEIDDCWQITKTITNLDKGALNLAGMILKKTIHQTQSGEITPREASQVLSGTGMRVDQVYSRYAPQQATTAIQINNDNNRVIVELVD